MKTKFLKAKILLDEETHDTLLNVNDISSMVEHDGGKVTIKMMSGDVFLLEDITLKTIRRRINAIWRFSIVQ